MCEEIRAKKKRGVKKGENRGEYHDDPPPWSNIKIKYLAIKIHSCRGRRQRKGVCVTGQISITEYIHDRDNVTFKSCNLCVCQSCLYWWSERCPYGKCYDDYRAETDPYDAAHSNKPLRTGWSDWDQQGEQAHWCRGGVFYPVHYCREFVKYQGQQVKDCLEAVVSVFQDGYISCSLVDSVGCQECYRRFEEWMDRL